MVGQQVVETKRTRLLSNVIQKIVKRKGYTDIRSKADGYDDPSTLRRVGDSVVCVPDISAQKNGKKSYFEVALKPDKESLKQRIISKWKLLGNLAKMRHGKLFLVAPHGNYAFVKRTCDQYNIDAVIVKYRH